MIQFSYVYGIGGLVFLMGLFVAFRSGHLGLAGAGFKRLLLCLGGLAFFAGLQGFLQFGDFTAAPAGGFTGKLEDVSGEALATPLDWGIVIGYFLLILVLGTWFGKNQKDTKDFFFGGQRFSWWLITFSLLATTVGSYSFVKYSRVSYKYGLASSQTYLNDWYWFPLLAFVWIPILYFSRITSIPEYFERRFDRRTRRAVTGLLLIYLISYVGVNLFTMGKVLNILLGWDVLTAAVIVACISAVYVTAGGQTSVIVTDLFQGVMLLATGLVLVFLGAQLMGGLDQLWAHLPVDNRRAFTNFAEDPSYSTVGIFWQDAMANTAMFYFVNQGMAMRFMAARSVGEARKSAMAVLLILMPVAALVVASGGWVGSSLAHGGHLPSNMEPAKVFFITAKFLSQPGVFGLILAALTAALMSTVDTLITAVSAIAVNDIYGPARPNANEEQKLKVARWVAIGTTLVGIALVPIFNQFKSIYAAHGAMTACVTPPLVIAMILALVWKRYTATAAFATVVGGAFAVGVSIFVPELVAPFAHGMEPGGSGDGLFSGLRQYKYTRALYGLYISFSIAVIVTWLTAPKADKEIKGLTWGPIGNAVALYLGRPGTDDEGRWVQTSLRLTDTDLPLADNDLQTVTMSAALAETLQAQEGDLLFLSDARPWLGGLRACHAVLGSVEPGEEAWLSVGPSVRERAVAPGREDQPFRVRRLYG